MTEHEPPADPQPEPTEPTDAGQEAADAKPKKSSGYKLPLESPVFGKVSWLVCVVPFVVYLGGLGFAGWIENGRAHTH